MLTLSSRRFNNTYINHGIIKHQILLQIETQFGVMEDVKLNFLKMRNWLPVS